METIMVKGFHYILGKRGEEKAREFLVAHGYTIIAMNYVCPLGEIDIIAREKNILCFIEIKTRCSSQFGFPAEAINKKKQKKLIDVARFYLNQQRSPFNEYRFDIVEVFYDKGKDCFSEFTIIKDAFEVSG